MLHLIAQVATQPTADDLPLWAKAIIAILAAIGSLAVLLYPMIRQIMRDAREASANAAAANATANATQQSVTRLSNRQNAAESKLTDLAHKLPPPEGGAGAPAFYNPVSPAGGAATYTTTNTAGTNWTPNQPKP